MSVLWLLIRSGEPVAAIAKLVAAVPVPAAFLQLLWPLPPPVFSSLRRRYNIDAILVSRLHQTCRWCMNRWMKKNEEDAQNAIISLHCLPARTTLMRVSLTFNSPIIFPASEEEHNWTQGLDSRSDQSLASFVSQLREINCTQNTMISSLRQ